VIRFFSLELALKDKNSNTIGRLQQGAFLSGHFAPSQGSSACRPPPLRGSHMFKTPALRKVACPKKPPNKNRHTAVLYGV